MWGIRGFKGVAACLSILTIAQAAPAQTSSSIQKTDRATVTIGITVGPIAEIYFPEGQSFDLRVNGAGNSAQAMKPTETAELPFVVRGNATAVIDAQPGESIRNAKGEFGLARSSSQSAAATDVLAYRLDIQYTDKKMGAHRATGQRGRQRDRTATSRVISQIDVAQRSRTGTFRIEGFSQIFGSKSGSYRGDLLVLLSAEL